MKPPPTAPPLSLTDFTRRKVALGGRAIPAWILALVLIGCAATPVGLAALNMAAVAVAHPTALGESTVERASKGDPDAMKELENVAQSERTIEQIVALADGRAARSKATLDSLADEVQLSPKGKEDPEVLGRLYEATKNPEQARRALKILATMPGPASADLIYEVWVGTKERTETTRLAQELVYSDRVRRRASPGLSALLDLRDSRTCEDVSKALDRIAEHGDRRSLRPLSKLQAQRGCGAGMSEDCYPCLRNDERLTDTISAIVKQDNPA